MAARYWPGEDAIGRQFMMGTDDKPWLTIVGIVGTVRHNAVVEEPRAEMYVAHAQLPAHIRSAPRGMTLVDQDRRRSAELRGARFATRCARSIATCRCRTFTTMEARDGGGAVAAALRHVPARRCSRPSR